MIWIHSQIRDKLITVESDVKGYSGEQKNSIFDSQKLTYAEHCYQ